MLARALIPAGFMPGQSATGALTVEFCSGVASHQIVVHYSDDGHPLPERPRSHEPCPYAASATSAPPPAPVALPASAPAVRLTPDQSDLTVEYLDPLRRPGARAPPQAA